MNHNCNIAVFYFIDRKTQDDNRSKAEISALFRYPQNAEDFIGTLPEETRERFYIDNLDGVETAERFYNHLQDIKEKYGDHWIFHVNDGAWTTDELNKYREEFHAWN